MPDRIKRIWRDYAPECAAFVLAVIAFVWYSMRAPGFLDASYLFDSSTLYTEVGLMSLSMTLVIITGRIDLSVTSILALVGAIIAILSSRMHVPIPALIVLAPVVGRGLGWINGYLVAKRGLPSLVVTLGTMALFRGVARILLGDQSISMPEAFVGIQQRLIPKTYFPVTLVGLIIVAALFWLLLHKRVFGKQAAMVGINEEGALYSGIPVEKVLTKVFVLSGVMAGVSALTMLSRLGVSRYDHAQGMELDVITAVVLGGASISGGRGTIVGSMIALLLVGTVRTGLGVSGVKSEIQVTAIGLLLIIAVLIARFTRRTR